MAKICIITYGCTANQDNSAIIKGILSRKHNIVCDAEMADVVIINSCIVKSTTANKIKSAIEKHIGKKMVITGCMPGPEQKLLRRIAPGACLVNNFNIKNIGKSVDSILKNRKEDYLARKKEEKLGIKKIFEGNKAILQISEGCASNCSFCETKIAKGNIMSFPQEKIEQELKKYIKQGYKTISITSTDNGCYGFDMKSNLAVLLKRLAAIKGGFRLRIGMMNPRHVIKHLDDMLVAYKNKKIIKFLHIPVQSGSDKVLREMNRQYTAEEFKNIVERFRKEIQGINISTDIIVGYPTENEQDFNETVALIKKIKPDVLNISKFGPRPGTRAARLKQLPTEVVKERSRILTEEFKKIKIDK